MSDRKRGRPTDNPKDAARITVRLDSESLCTLNEYCNRKGVSRNEAIRIAIGNLKKGDK